MTVASDCQWLRLLVSGSQCYAVRAVAETTFNHVVAI